MSKQKPPQNSTQNLEKIKAELHKRRNKVAISLKKTPVNTDKTPAPK
jgi:hypothetical protein